MDAIKALMKHRTIRKFKSDPIDDTILHKILEAGFRASTTGNMQVYSVIITKNEKKRQKLWEYHFKQNMVLQAPLLLTFCADFNRFSQWCRQRKAEPGYDNFLSFTTAAIDALLVAQNVAIAAEALGLGICYLGTTTYNADKLVDFFECPEGVVPITTLVIGYPDEKPALSDRLPFDAVVHHEKYKPYTAKAIDDYYSEKESLPLTAKLLEENQLENLAQIYTTKRYTKKDNVNYSRSLLRLLTKQGFMGF
jgi:nitroreductase